MLVQDSGHVYHYGCAYLSDSVGGRLLGFFLDVVTDSRLIALVFSVCRLNRRRRFRIVSHLNVLLIGLSNRCRLRHLLRLSLLLGLLELKVILLLLLATEEDANRSTQRLVDLAVIGREGRMLAYGTGRREGGVAFAWYQLNALRQRARAGR